MKHQPLQVSAFLSLAIVFCVFSYSQCAKLSYLLDVAPNTPNFGALSSAASFAASSSSPLNLSPLISSPTSTSSFITHSNANPNSLSNRLMRLVFKELFAYVAAPVFMPIAFGRALRKPPGLGPESAVLSRFGRFLLKRLTTNRQTQSNEEDQKRDQFMKLLTKNRKNIMSTMKQFRDHERNTNKNKLD